MLNIKAVLAKLLQSHAAIGTRKSKTGSSISVPNKTYTNIASVTLEPGTWVVFADARFPSNSTGLRYIELGPNSAAANTVYSCVNATSGAITSGVVGWTWTLTQTTTEYLVVYQTSGSTLNVTGYIAAVRIK